MAWCVRVELRAALEQAPIPHQPACCRGGAGRRLRPARHFQTQLPVLVQIHALLPLLRRLGAGVRSSLLVALFRPQHVFAELVEVELSVAILVDLIEVYNELAHCDIKGLMGGLLLGGGREEARLGSGGCGLWHGDWREGVACGATATVTD